MKLTTHLEFSFRCPAFKESSRVQFEQPVNILVNPKPIRNPARKNGKSVYCVTAVIYTHVNHVSVRIPMSCVIKAIRGECETMRVGWRKESIARRRRRGSTSYFHTTIETVLRTPGDETRTVRKQKISCGKSFQKSAAGEVLGGRGGAVYLVRRFAGCFF